MKAYLLSFVGDFGEHIKYLFEVLEVIVVLRGAQTEEVEEVFLVVQCHADVVSFEDGCEVLCRN